MGIVLFSQANTLCPAPWNKQKKTKWGGKKNNTQVRRKIPSVWILMRLHKQQLCLSQLQTWNYEFHPKSLGRCQRELFLFPPLPGRNGGKKQAECLCVWSHLYTEHWLDCFWNPTNCKISQQMPLLRCLPVTFTQGKGQVDNSIPAQLPPVSGNLIFTMCTFARW